MRLAITLVAVFAVVAAAQDASVTVSTNAVFKGQLRSAVMGATVKGAPYSAMETVENTQTLGDGTHINQTVQTMVYRDSQGRMRRETPDSITIWDPVASTSYVLDPKTQTAHQMPLGMVTDGATAITATKAGAAGQVMHFEYRTGTPAVAAPLLRAEAGNLAMLAAGPLPGLMNMKQVRLNDQTESLGHQTIEGIDTEGTRITATIDTGAIGNDRPIQIVTERWYSADLQTNVKMTHSDPRMGQETLQVTGISRAEPAPDLFQVPAGYQLLSNGK